MGDIYLHGIETQEKTNSPRPVRTIDTGIIGLIGTAPLADEVLFPLNTPIPIYGYEDYPQGLGSTGTLPDAVRAIFAQATRASQTIVMVRVADSGTDTVQLGNILGNPSTKTGMHAFRRAKSELNLAPKLLICPGFTSDRPTDGISGIAVSNGGSGYTSAPTIAITGDGVGAQAVCTIDESGAVDEIVVTNPGRGYTTTPTLTFNGGGGTGAAGTVSLGACANPVTMGLLEIANRLRACVIVDGPNTNSTAAVQYRLDYDTDRLLIVDPMVKAVKAGSIVSLPAAPYVAGLQAVVDYDEGFWYSPSNHVINGIVGPGRVVEHSLNDPSAESQFLNKNAVATIIRSPSGGYKLWGSRVPSSDTLKQFWSVRRAHDTIIESIELAHEPYVDKPFSKQVLVEIAETVNRALRRWKVLGATLGGRVWLDASYNTAETMAQGMLYVHYDAEAPAPIEHLIFVFNRNTGYYTALAESAAREVERIAALARNA
jgi:uncharacterized protein